MLLLFLENFSFVLLITATAHLQTISFVWVSKETCREAAMVWREATGSNDEGCVLGVEGV
jgi:hypothetical protein